MGKIIKVVIGLIILILLGLYIHDYIVGKKGSDYLESCIGLTDSSVDACTKAAKALYYNKAILFK